MAQKYRIEKYSDNSVVLSNVRNNIEVPILGVNETITATRVSQWYDDSVMDDSKVDGKIYLKFKGEGEYKNSYFKANLPNDKLLFLEKDTMQDMRDISSTEVLLLKMGYYRGVRLNGYYKKDDTPNSIDYFISNTANADDGGSVIDIEDIKLEHNFGSVVDVRYFGLKVGDDENYYIDNILTALSYNIGQPKIVQLPSGVIWSDKRIRIPSNTILQGEGKNNTFIKWKPRPETTDETRYDGIDFVHGVTKSSVRWLCVEGFRSMSGLNSQEVYGIVCYKSEWVDVYECKVINCQSAGIRIGYSSTLGDSKNFRVFNNDIEGIFSGHGVELIRCEEGVAYGNNIKNVSEHGYRFVGCINVSEWGSIIQSGLNACYFGSFGGSPGAKTQYNVIATQNIIFLNIPGCSGAIFRSKSQNCAFHSNEITGIGIGDDIVGVRYLDTENDGIGPVNCSDYNNKITNVSIGVVFDKAAQECKSYQNTIKNTYGGYGVYSRNAPANFNRNSIYSNTIIQDNDLNQKGIVFTSNSLINENYIYSNEIYQRIINDSVRTTGVGKVWRNRKLNSVKFTRGGNSLILTGEAINFINNIQTGTLVQVSSTETLPSPLVANTPYFVIWGLQSDRFQLASTMIDAINNVPITITTAGTGILSVTLFKNEDTNSVKVI